ncbi:MAG: M20 family peptidase [Nevskiaceae bacterium]|nr:MAG: M20 family peptidase [Nevskiaceae bacterium]
MKFLTKIAVAVLLPLAVVLAWNTSRLQPPSPPANALPPLPLDEAGAAQRLAGAVRIPTISYEDRQRIDAKALDDLADYLVRSYPRVHATLQRERVGHSLLYTWPGRDAAAKPVLLLAHLDVVPVEPGSEKSWTHAPFSGDIADGYVWGRGALDDKNCALALMETAETLLAQGFAPRQTIYFAFGEDEEIGGAEGAAKIAALLKSRGVHAAFSLDEGGAITHGIVNGITRPVATIMAAEKGYLSLRLSAKASGGHSSMPPGETAIGQLARAVARVQNRRLPGRLVAPVTDMLDRLAPEMPLGQRVAVANRWLFAPLLVRVMSRTPVGNALVRTTTAPTMFNSGVKDNVLPSEATAIINFRLLPGDRIEDVERHVKLAIADDRITVRREDDFARNPTAVSDTHSAAFDVLERSIREIYPEVVVSTGLMFGASDTRNYEGVYDNRYNFSPTLYEPADLARVHGTDERVSVKGYADMIRWYVRLLQNLNETG